MPQANRAPKEQPVPSHEPRDAKDSDRLKQESSDSYRRAVDAVNRARDRDIEQALRSRA